MEPKMSEIVIETNAIIKLSWRAFAPPALRETLYALAVILGGIKIGGLVKNSPLILKVVDNIQKKGKRVTPRKIATTIQIMMSLTDFVARTCNLLVFTISLQIK
jgi:hypothetical protein